MIINVTLSTEDYLLFLQETAYSSKINRYILYLGFLLIIGMVLKILLSGESLQNSDLALVTIGGMIAALPELSLFLEKKRFLNAEYKDDLLHDHQIVFENDQLIFSVDDQVFSRKYNEIHLFYELEHFYVVALSEIRHFPIPKRILDQNEKEHLYEIFS